MGLFVWAGRKMPRHFGPSHVTAAERLFARWGMLAVFFGRFIALLRIFAGPLAGALRMHYPRFLIANVLGGICWAAGTTFAVYFLGIVAERWLQRFSWIWAGRRRDRRAHDRRRGEAAHGPPGPEDDPVRVQPP